MFNFPLADILQSLIQDAKITLKVLFTSSFLLSIIHAFHLLPVFRLT